MTVNKVPDPCFRKEYRFRNCRRNSVQKALRGVVCRDKKQCRHRHRALGHSIPQMPARKPLERSEKPHPDTGTLS